MSNLGDIGTGRNINIPRQPTHLLTFLFGKPETSSFTDDHNTDPNWFDPKMQFLVSAKSSGTKYLAFGRLKFLVRSLAAGLRYRGLQSGARVLVISPETICIPLILLATIAAGGVFVGRTNNFTAEEQVAVMNHCDPFFIIAYKGCEIVAANAARVSNKFDRFYTYDDGLLDIITLESIQMSSTDSPKSLIELLDHRAAPSFHWREFTTHSDTAITAMIIYTSGSTGIPKGVEFTHQTLILGSARYQTTYPLPAHQEDWAHNLSTTTLGAVSVLLRALKSRNRLTVYDFPTFNLNDYFTFVNLQKTNIIYATKQALDALITCWSLPDLSDVHSVFTGGTIIPQRTRQAINDLFGRPVTRTLYTFTEAGAAIAMEPQGCPAGSSSCVGKLLPNIQVRTVGTSGDDFGSSQPGELYFRTPTTMKSYWRDRQATDDAFLVDAFTGERFVKSGDVGFLNYEGNLHITHRAKEVFKVNGRFVNQSDIENTLMAMRGVGIACVVGIPNSINNEALPRAYIVQDGRNGLEITDEDVYAYMGRQMDNDHQLTGGVAFVKEGWLPYEDNGKVMRRAVQAWAQEEFEAYMN